MKQPGRKSASALATVTTFPTRMLAPPDDLTPQEAEVWCRVVATKPADWFDAGSTPLLAQFCRATVQSDRIAGLVEQVSLALLTDANELGRYKELRKIQAQLSAELTSLATKMRLSQQSRYGARGADGAAGKASGRKPWQSPVVAEN